MHSEKDASKGEGDNASLGEGFASVSVATRPLNPAPRSVSMENPRP
jgi:hypothetical protein